MAEALKQSAYFQLIEQSKEVTPLLSPASRLAGKFADAVFDGMQAELDREEMAAAVAIGHYLGSRQENVPPNYVLILMQLIYWEVVYEEAEEYWARRYHGDEE